MPEIFFISDTHFGDAGILKTQSLHRPFSTITEHDEALVERWNAAVADRDVVWHLGDFAVGSIAIAARLNGRKRLVMGNHDTRRPAEYARYFDRVMGAVRYGDFLLTHMPVHPVQLYQCKVNLHGHMHKGAVESDPRYLNVSCEHTGLTPISLEDVMVRTSMAGEKANP